MLAENSRELKTYLPPVLANIRDLASLTAAEQPYFSAAWQHAAQTLAEQFVWLAGEYGIGRWEKMLAMAVPENLTLEERRQLVLRRLSEQLPFTLPRLQDFLAAIAPQGQYTLVVDNGAYTVHVYVSLAGKAALPALRELLERVLPANLLLDLQLLYNKYSMLARYTHAQLGRYSHWAIKEEVLV